MRVAYVVKQYPRYSETFIVNELLAHEAAGMELEIYSLRPAADRHFQDRIARVRAPVNYVPEGAKFSDFWNALDKARHSLPGVYAVLDELHGADAHDLFQAVLLAHDVRLKEIDHLHAHFASVATTVARLAARLADVPYTFTAHAKDIYHSSVQTQDMREKLSDAAAVVTVTDYNVEYLREVYGRAADGVRRVYNGLDLDQFPYCSPQDRPRRIVAVGRLVEKKGFADLLEACALLARQGLDFRCQIIGDGEQKAALQERLARLHLGARVELMGPRPQCEIIRHVQGAAVMACPCVIGGDGNRDGLPTVLLESMALGTPCVSTDVTGIPEIVRDRLTGFLVPQRDPAAVAAALEQLLTNAPLRVQLAQRARQLVESQFDIQSNAAQLRELFRAAVERGQAAFQGAR